MDFESVRAAAAAISKVLQKLLAEMWRFRGGLVFKAHRLLYHSTLGLNIIKKEKKKKKG